MMPLRFMSAEEMKRFPPGFLWGVATSAFQVEGGANEDGRGASIWDTFCRVPGAIRDNSNGDVACDHYHRFEQDLDLMVEIGVQAYRFSIAWPRVQPDGFGKWNPKGIAFYDRLIDGLLKRNIAPFITLYHWDLPQALQDRGGWNSRDTASYFAEYADYACRRFGDRAYAIATHNEPWVVATMGHESGFYAPGMRDRKVATQVSHHLLLSHGLAMQAMRASGTSAKLGIVLNQGPMMPATDAPEDVALAKREDGLLIRWYMDALFRGAYPVDVLEHLGPDSPVVNDGDFDIIQIPMDFLGINYYSRGVLSHNGSCGEAPLGYTDMGWEVYPQGLVDLLVRLNRDYRLPPLYITENGAAYPDTVEDSSIHDKKRTEFLQWHVNALAEAIAAGVDVRGYFVWSLLDNFEWAYGYTKRFGIVYVDYDTQRRILKDSGLWYRDFLASQRQTTVST